MVTAMKLAEPWYQSITSTGLFTTLAETVYERHLLFSEILTRLGVEEKTALRDACHMEHAMSAESFEALKEHFIKYEADLPLPEKGDVYECSDRGRKRGDDGAV